MSTLTARRLWTIVLCAFAPYTVVAQLLLTGPDTLRASGAVSQFEIVGYGGITNRGSAPVTVRWKRIGSQLPSNWTSAVCDFNGCYLPTTDSAELVLPANDTSNLDVHFYINNQNGLGYQTIRLTLLGNGQTLTVTYIASTLGSSVRALHHDRPQADFQAMGSQLWVGLPEGNFKGRIVLLDAGGRTIRTVSVEDAVVRMNLGDLSPGVYQAYWLDGTEAQPYRFFLQP